MAGQKLADARHQGTVLKQDLEKAKRDFQALSGAVADLVRGDVYVLASLYEAIFEHVQCCAGAIEGLLARKKAGLDDVAMYTEIDGVLDGLVRDIRIEVKAVAVSREPAYENILPEKRREILDHLFSKLERDRRTLRDRRTQADKRRYATPVAAASERRAGKDRRCVKDRRR